MKNLILITLVGLFLISCSIKPEVMNEWTMPIPQEEAIYEIIDESPMAAVKRDLTPLSYTLSTPPVLNYTGGSSISTPKFVARPVQIIKLVNPCSAGGLQNKTMDMGLSLAYNLRGIYSVEAVNSSGVPLMLYGKRAMGAAVPFSDSTYVQNCGSYGKIFAVKLTPADGAEITIKVTQVQKPAFYPISATTGFQGAHCLFYTRGA